MEEEKVKPSCDLKTKDPHHRLNTVLNHAFDQALDAYGQIVREKPSLDAKHITAQQNACKAILSHVDIIFKWFDAFKASDGKGDKEMVLKETLQTDLLEKARTALCDLRERRDEK